MMEDSGREILVPMNNGKIDLGVKHQWRFFGADVRTIEEEGKQKDAAANC